MIEACLVLMCMVTLAIATLLVYVAKVFCKHAIDSMVAADEALNQMIWVGDMVRKRQRQQVTAHD